MKKPIIFAVIIFVILALLLSGCNESNKNQESTGSNEYTMTYAELYSDVIYIGENQVPSFGTYKDGDIINIKDTIVSVYIASDVSEDPITTVTFGNQVLQLYFLGNLTSTYTPGQEVTIKTNVKECTLTDGTDVIWLENWWIMYVAGIVYSPEETDVNVQFDQDTEQNTLLVIVADPPDLLWQDFLIDGTCDTSSLGAYVEAGDLITGCAGTISISYVINNQVIGFWTFS